MYTKDITAVNWLDNDLVLVYNSVPDLVDDTTTTTRKTKDPEVGWIDKIITIPTCIHDYNHEMKGTVSSH